MKFFDRFKHLDIPLLAAMLLLAAAGLTMLYSASLPSGSTTTFWRQVIFFVAGFTGFLFFSFFDYHTLAKANRILYVVAIIMLGYLLTFGALIRGGRRWIPLGFFNLQPAEFVKIVVILGLSRLLYLRRGQINSWSNIGWSFLYAVIPALLIIGEPDLGSATVIICIWAGVILLSKIRRKFLLIIFLVFLAICGGTWKFALKSFQKDRILVFLDPALDPKGRGYNVRQAAIAVGSGRLLGQGLGQGLQSQQQFLPEQQTDFIFAATAEEVGFVGLAALLGLYGFLLSRLIVTMRKAKDELGMYIAGGVFFLLFVHIVVNIDMNIGLLPVTGIPLPFFSAGGSSLIVILIALGIVQNVNMQSKTLRF